MTAVVESGNTTPVVETKVVTEVTTKAESDSVPADAGTDTTNVDDASGADPHVDVKTGLMTAAANCLAAAFNKEITWDEAKKMLDEYMADYAKYDGGEEAEADAEDKAEGDEDETEDEEADDAEKSAKLDAFIEEARKNFEEQKQYNELTANALQRLLSGQ